MASTSHVYHKSNNATRSVSSAELGVGELVEIRRRDPRAGEPTGGAGPACARVRGRLSAYDAAAQDVPVEMILAVGERHGMIRLQVPDVRGQ